MEDFVVQGKGPKRVGALYVTCQLFKVYFKVSVKFFWCISCMVLLIYASGAFCIL